MADVKQIILPVQGMTCASCVGHVERALKKVQGVTNAHVNLATERAAVDLAPNGNGTADLVAAVRDAGYQVPLETITLPIGGMTCASCVGHVERALGKVEGVTHASVNLATEKATVTFVPGVAGPAEFRQAVANAGYQVLEIPEAASGGEEEVDQEELKMQAARFRMRIAFIGWFLENAATASYRQVALRELLAGHTVCEVMMTDCPRILPGLTLDVLVDQVVLSSGRRCFPVMEDDELDGRLTLHRIKQVARERWPTTQVEDVMIPKAELKTVKPDDDLADVFERMTTEDLNQFPVVDAEGGRLLGLVARSNVLAFLRAQAELGL